MYRSKYSNRVSFQRTFVAGDNPHMIPLVPGLPGPDTACSHCCHQEDDTEGSAVLPPEYRKTFLFRLRLLNSSFTL